MSTIITIKGTNGSGKSSVVRALMEHLGKAATLRFHNKDAGYRCRYGDGNLFVLGKYKSACGGLDSSFSYKGAADDVMVCLDALAAKGHVVCEGIIAVNYYGFGRVTRFVREQKAKGNHVIFARLDTPVQLCVERVQQRRRQAGNYKPFNSEHLVHKHEALLRMQEKLREAGYDARVLPHEDPLQTLLRWLAERLTPEESARLVESELHKLRQSKVQLTDGRCEVQCAKLESHIESVPGATPRQTQAPAPRIVPKNLREKFIQYYVAKQAVGDVDPTHYIISDIFESHALDKEQQLWVAFLYATLYSPHRLLATLSKFPELKGTECGELRDWEQVMYRALGLDPDRIKFMRPPTLSKIFAAYKEALGERTQEEFFHELIGSDPVASFYAITEKLRSIKYVGRHTAYAWTEILIRCVKLPIRCDTIFVKEANSPRKGLLLALALRGSDPRGKNYVWLDGQIKGIINEIQQRYPEIKVDHHYVETVLCQFKNFVKGKRRVGYYLDEQAGNIVRGALFYPGANWREIWELRARHTNDEHLPEYTEPTQLMKRPGFIDACTQTWLKRRENREKVARYLSDLQSCLTPIVQGVAHR